MFIGGVHLPDAALRRQYTANTDALLGGDPLFAQLAEETARISGQNTHPHKSVTVGMMPVAYFGIRAAVETARDPEVAPLLPLNVERRGAVVRGCSRLMINQARIDGILTRYYRGTPSLRPLLSKANSAMQLIFNDFAGVGEESLTPLGDTAILDETIVAGGALRFLRRDQPAALQAESAAAIVGRSVGLQLVARVPDDVLEQMREHLGAPYTHVENLRFEHGAVDFTPAARAYLHSLMEPGYGCPAHGALTDDASGKPTFLRLAWSEIADVLLPPGAKAERPPAARGKGPRGKKR
ncbi:MAG TPA: hypothetical protein VF466_02870 [Candidatus Saccharimonadales bacterium]